MSRWFHRADPHSSARRTPYRPDSNAPDNTLMLLFMMPVAPTLEEAADALSCSTDEILAIIRRINYFAKDHRIKVKQRRGASYVELFLTDAGPVHLKWLINAEGACEYPVIRDIEKAVSNRAVRTH